MLYLLASNEKAKLSDLRSDLFSLPRNKRLYQSFVLKLFDVYQIYCDRLFSVALSTPHNITTGKWEVQIFNFFSLIFTIISVFCIFLLLQYQNPQFQGTNIFSTFFTFLIFFSNVWQ